MRLTMLVVLASALAVAALTAPAARPAPDGRWLVAFSTEHGLYVGSPGGPVRRIRRGAGFGLFAWSPDGRWIAYAHNDPDGIFVTSASGDQTWRVHRGLSAFSWSPDGRRLAFADWDGVRVAAWDGSVERRVIRYGPCEAAWAGERVVATCGKRLLEVAPDGSGLRILDRPPGDGWTAFPSGSPDGKLVAFGRHCYETPIGSDTYCEIAVVRPADLWRRTLVPYRVGDWQGPYDAPVWIPGTTRLLVDELEAGRYEVREVDAATGASWGMLPLAAARLTTAPDGSFATQDAAGIAFRAPDGRIVGRLRIPPRATLDIEVEWRPGG